MRLRSTKWEEAVQNTVPLNGALKMKLELTGAVWDPDYGFANVMVS